MQPRLQHRYRWDNAMRMATMLSLAEGVRYKVWREDGPGVPDLGPRRWAFAPLIGEPCS